MIRNFPELLEMREKNFPVLFGTACWGKISCTVHDCLGKDFLYCPVSMTAGERFPVLSMTAGERFPVLSKTAGERFPVLSLTAEEKISCTVHDSWGKITCAVQYQ